MSESPDRAVNPLWLAEDVAEFLHDLADKEFGGDVELAMNESIRAIMVAMQEPDNPWAAVSWQARRKAERRGRQR